MSHLNTRTDSAYYALLLTQARDKNFIPQTDDSLIQIAVRHYDAIHNGQMQAKAYFYWGSIFRDKNEQAIATQKYYMAADFAQKAKDHELTGRIYNNIAYIYSLQQLYNKADSIYQLVERIGFQEKDTALYAEAISAQGKIKLYQKKYSEAENKLKQAAHLLRNSDKDGIRANIAATLSSLYGRTGKRAEAINYAKQNIALQKDTLHCYRAFLLLGDAYFKMQQYDSATIYINKALPSPSHADKAGSYMRLADIYKIQGDIIQSLEMERLYSAYKDSLTQSSQSNEILEVTQQILTQQQSRYEDFLNKYRYYIAGVILIGILLFFILRKRYQQRIRQQIKERIEAEKALNLQHAQLKQELKQKEEQILSLQNKISQDSTNKERKKSLQKELAKMEGQRIALVQKTLEHLDVYAKIQRIISDRKKKGSLKESLTEDEWLKLMVETDKDGVISRLNAQYNLEKDEVYLCCLSLIGLSPTDKSIVMHCTRPTIYRKEKKLFYKMGKEYEPDKLNILL